MKQTYKIGIAIVHCLSKGNSSGFDVVHTTDKDKWIDSIEDTGRVFNYVINTQDSIIRLIRLECEGWYICSMIPTTDREHEYRASWIYIPIALNLKASDIKSILTEVEPQITTSDYDGSKLNDLAQRYSFDGSTSYPQFIIPSEQKGYAIRYVGGTNPSLYDIFENIYQKEYCKYNWIILLPKDGTELVAGSNISDITGSKFSTSTIINPDINSNGFVPYINNQEFLRPLRLFDGEVATFVWKKTGYADIPVKVSKQEDLVVPPTKISRQFNNKFNVVDRLTQCPITSAKVIIITKYEKDNFGHIYIAEKDLPNVVFSVSATGYVRREFNMDFSKIPVDGSIPTIELNPEEHKYIFLLPVDNKVVKDRKKIKIEIKSQYKIIDSPIEGYTCLGRVSEDRDNELKFKPQEIYNPISTKEKEKGGTPKGTHPKSDNRPNRPKFLSKPLQYVILAILVVCIVGLIWFLLFMDETPQTHTTPNPPNEIAETITEQKNDSWEDALKTLKSCETVWEKDVLSKHKDLDGVYEMINKYKFDEIIFFYQSHESDLREIDDWNRLYQYAIKKMEKTGEYSQDGSITINNYLNKISGLPDKTNDTVYSGSSSTSENSGISSVTTNKNNVQNETNSNWD